VSRKKNEKSAGLIGFAAFGGHHVATMPSCNNIKLSEPVDKAGSGYNYRATFIVRIQSNNPMMCR
jgi:hypothetical protein